MLTLLSGFMTDYDLSELISEEFGRNAFPIDGIVLHVLCDKGFVTVGCIVFPNTARYTSMPKRKQLSSSQNVSCYMIYHFQSLL